MVTPPPLDSPRNKPFAMSIHGLRQTSTPQPKNRHAKMHDTTPVGVPVCQMDYKAHTYVHIKAGTHVCSHEGYVSVMVVCISWRTEEGGPLHTKTKFYTGACVVKTQDDKETGDGSEGKGTTPMTKANQGEMRYTIG